MISTRTREERVMSRQKWPPIAPGARVRTTQSNTPSDEWTDEVQASRQWGVEGEVRTHHDSHGLCYEVMHSDGTVGSYDPTELEVL